MSDTTQGNSGTGKPSSAKYLTSSGQPNANRRTQKFTFEDDEPEVREQITDQNFTRGKADMSSLVVPLGNIHDSDAIHKRSNKPVVKETKSKWSGKGEQLSTDAAIQFMIKERAMMDLETAQLRRDNEKLRRSLEQKQLQGDRSPGVVSSRVSIQSNIVDNAESTNAELRDQLEKLKADNERLKMQHIVQGNGSDGDSGATAIPEAPSSLTLALAAGEALSPSNISRGSYRGSSGQASKLLHAAADEEQSITISSLLWDGGYLWKIPYNGKGAPERRIVALKRASLYPHPAARAVRIDRAGSLSPTDENYIVFPPTLMWYNSDKPGEIQNARELVLYEGTCLMEGHNTNAFFKLTSRDKPVPLPELCFSIMTTTRSLDLAAETADSANVWKATLHALLIEFSPNKEWALKNLRRNKPFWDQSAMELVPPSPVNSNMKSPLAPQHDDLGQGKSHNESHSRKDMKNKHKDKDKDKEKDTGRGKTNFNIPSPNLTEFHKQLIDIYTLYNPSKISSIPAILENFKGREVQLLTELYKKYDIQDGTYTHTGAEVNDTAIRTSGTYTSTGTGVSIGISSKPMKKEAIKRQLFSATRAKDYKQVEQLFKAGVPANLQDESNEGYNDTPLMICCRTGDADIARICLQYGAKNDPHPDFGETALHLATYYGHHDVAAIILAAAAQSEADHMISNLTNEEKKTPLHLAASRGYIDLIDLLLTHGAVLDNKDELDQTVLHLCCAAGHREVLAALLDQGGDHLLEYPDLGGNTPLHHAAMGGHWHCIKLLLETAADVMVRNTRGQTAYKLSLEQGHHQIGKLLLVYMKDYKDTQTQILASTSTSGTGMGVNTPQKGDKIKCSSKLHIDYDDKDNSGYDYEYDASWRAPSTASAGGNSHNHSTTAAGGAGTGTETDEVTLNIHYHEYGSRNEGIGSMGMGTPQGKGVSSPYPPYSPYSNNGATGGAGAVLPRPHSAQTSPSTRLQHGQSPIANPNYRKHVTVTSATGSPVPYLQSQVSSPYNQHQFQHQQQQSPNQRIRSSSEGVGGYISLTGQGHAHAAYHSQSSSPHGYGYEQEQEQGQGQWGEHSGNAYGDDSGGLGGYDAYGYQTQGQGYDAYGHQPPQAPLSYSPHSQSHSYSSFPSSVPSQGSTSARAWGPSDGDGSAGGQVCHSPHSAGIHSARERPTPSSFEGVHVQQGWQGQGQGLSLQQRHHQQQHAWDHDNSNSNYNAYATTTTPASFISAPLMMRSQSDPINGMINSSSNADSSNGGRNGPMFYKMDPSKRVYMSHDFDNGNGNSNDNDNAYGIAIPEHHDGEQHGHNYDENSAGGGDSGSGSVGLWVGEGDPNSHLHGDVHALTETREGDRDVADNGGGDVDGAEEQFESCGRYWASYYTDEGHLYYLEQTHSTDSHSQWYDPRTHGVVYEAEAEEEEEEEEEAYDNDHGHSGGDDNDNGQSGLTVVISGGSGVYSETHTLDELGGHQAYGDINNTVPAPTASISPKKRTPPTDRKGPSPRSSPAQSPSGSPTHRSDRPQGHFYEGAGRRNVEMENKPEHDDHYAPNVQKNLFASNVTVQSHTTQQHQHSGKDKSLANGRKQPEKINRYDISDDDEDEDEHEHEQNAQMRSQVKQNSHHRDNMSFVSASADAGRGTGASVGGGRCGRGDRVDGPLASVGSVVSQSLNLTKDTVTNGSRGVASGGGAGGGIAAKVEAIARRRASLREASLERGDTNSNAETNASAEAGADAKEASPSKSLAHREGASAKQGMDTFMQASTSTSAAAAAMAKDIGNDHENGGNGDAVVTATTDSKNYHEDKTGSFSSAKPIFTATGAGAQSKPIGPPETPDAKITVAVVADQESIRNVMERKATYIQLLRNGEPMRIVRRHMEDAGEEKSLVKEILSIADSISPVPNKGKAASTSAGIGDAKQEEKNEEENTSTNDAKSVPTESIAELKSDATVGKYAKMASMGVPHGSVHAKMKVDGIETKDINRVLRALGLDEEPDTTTDVNVKVESIGQLKSDSFIGKYARMVGVPHGSVVAKMKVDNISIKDINRICRALGIEEELENNDATSKVSVAASKPIESIAELKSDATVGKYAKMASMGVPHGSVHAKMKVEGIETKDINRVLRALGVDEEPDANADAKDKASSNQGTSTDKSTNPLRAALSRGPATGRPSVKMQSLHWDTISEDKLNKSIWATAVGGHENAETHVNDADVREIEKLFAMADTKASNSAVSGTASTTSQKKTVDKATILVSIDGKRAQNLIIGLAQFKNIVSDHYDLMHAICSLDTLNGMLGPDHLENLRGLLPTSSELKAHTSGHLSTSEHPAEVFLSIACKFYPDLPKRLDCFLHIAYFADNSQQGIAKARKLVDACNEIISSDKLARVLQKMLAVGNVMNQGTFRGNATGFTVDSLLRMINMKGADKKTTVLDYVVKSLYDRGEERVLVVAEDLSVLEGVSKVSGAEIGKQLGEVDSAFESLQAELTHVREQLACGNTSSPGPSTNSTSKMPPPLPTGSKSMSETFVSRMEAQIVESTPRIEELRRYRRLMLRKVTEVVEYFGEDPANCDTVSIFGVLQEFRRALTSSREALARREKSLARAGAAGGKSGV